MIFQLMQFADSAFPLGGYAFSNGLEWLVKRGCIVDVRGFDDYLRGLVTQARYFEIPFLLAMRLDDDERRAAAQRYDRLMFVPGARTSSVAQGTALRRLCPAILPAQAFAEVSCRIASGRLQDHVVLVLGIVLDRLGWNREECAALYHYLLVRDQVSAAVRLGVIGAVRGLGLQHEIFAAIDRFNLDEVPHYSEAVRTTLLPEIALSDHANLYTKLFQN